MKSNSQSSRRKKTENKFHPVELASLTGEIELLITKCISAGRAVWQELGPGHSEAIYQRAMELETVGLNPKPLQITPVLYKGQTVGHHVPDLQCSLGASRVVVELKVAQSIGKPHLAQLAAYQRLLGLEYGLLINFPSILEEPFAFQIQRIQPVLII